jgi:4-amino-4-deoxy-L-arabinose transferase-like glycosyltransferase
MNDSLTRWRPLLLVILVLALAPYFIRIGASSLWDSNEAFYTETPREMMESGDYINPTFNYQPRFNKPPVSYWVVIAFYKLFGVSASSERLSIVLAAMVMIGIAYSLGNLIHSGEAGLLAAIALAIAPRFLMFSRRIVIDLYVAMFMAMALLFFVLSESRTARRRLWLVLMYVFIGLGILTKGPAAGILPAAVVLIYLAANRKLGRVREMMLPTGILIVAAVVLPWYLAIYARHGWAYISMFLFKDNLSRYTQTGWGPRRGVFFYLPVVIGDMFPWSMLLPAGLWLAFRRSDSPATETDSVGGSPNRYGPVFLLAIWIAAIVIFYSVSRSKEDLYILPVYPAAAALAGWIIAWLLSGKLDGRIARFANAMLITMGGLLVIAGVGGLYFFGQGIYRLVGATALGSIAIAAGLFTIAACWVRKHRHAILASAVSLVLFNWTFMIATLPDFERYKPVRSFCDVLSATAGPDALIGYYRIAYPSMVFYLQRQIFEYHQSEEIVTALCSSRPVYCVMLAQEYESMKPSLPVPTYVLASHPVFKVKLKSIRDRSELPQVVLISNITGETLAQ